MDPRTLAIPLAFILLAAVLCLLLIGSKWQWWQKLALIVIVPTFGLVVWHAIGSYKGWPTDSEPHRKALVFWIMVREPDLDGDPGAIYLWLRSFDDQVEARFNPLDYISRGGEPRAYVLPYSRLRHKRADKARNMLKDGRPVVIDFTKRGGSGDTEGGEGDGEGEPGGPGGYGVEDGRQDFQVYDLPPPQPPQKLPE